MPALPARYLLALALFLGVLLTSSLALSQDQIPSQQRFVVDIELQTLEQFDLLLQRANQLMLSGEVQQQGEAAVVFVLHGPVLRSLLKQNYPENRQTVDLAARLSALEVIDLKACRTWMGGNSVSESDLQPFVESVSYGPAEVEGLLKQGNYSYF